MLLIQEIANKDNEITQVVQVGNEYEIYVDYWDGSKLVFKTVGCKEIMYDPECASEVGDIDIENGVYSFKEAWYGEVFLRIEADDIVMDH